MSATIHSTALIAENVTFGDGVTVGPFAVIEEDVEIGDQSTIEAHAVIRRHVRLGSHNWVDSNAVIGGLPQDLSFDPASVSYVKTGDRNTFREGVTISRAATVDGATRIGSDCYFMNNSHVGHDCTLGDENIFASNAAIGGHVEVGDKIFLGGGAMVHQFCRIGSLAMIAGTSGVLQDLVPYSSSVYTPAQHYRLNVVGIKRAGIRGDNYRALVTAFKRLQQNRSLDDLPDSEEVNHLRSWLAVKSKRGVSAFVGARKRERADR